MIDPISTSHSGVLWEAYGSEPIVLKADEEKAQEQVVSYYYATTLQSLKTAADDSGCTAENSTCVESTSQDKTLYQRFTSWLGGKFSFKTQETDTGTEATPAKPGVVPVEPRSMAPRLMQPEPMSKERLSQHIAALNRELFQRLKETSEFEEEMRKSNSKKMDRLILFQIIQRSMEQKRLKESAGFSAHEDIFRLQQSNSDLTKQHYQILDEINSAAKTNKILHWVNIGSTVGIAGMIVAGFMTGGANVAYKVVFCALNLLKGGFSSAEGIMKYKIDLRKGEMTLIDHATRKNRNEINDKLTINQDMIEEISEALKTIHQLLDNRHQHIKQQVRFI